MPGHDLDVDDEVNMAFFKRDDKQAVTGEELMSWLESLPAGTILSLECSDGASLPVLVAEQDKTLQVGRQGMNKALEALTRGDECRLTARVQEKSLSLDKPKKDDWALEPRRDEAEEDNRRLVYRAELCLSMRVDVLLRVGEGLETRQVQARLHNLSIGGCLVELPMKADEILPRDETMVAVSLCFPDATQFSVNAWLSHRTMDEKSQTLQAGLRFHTVSAEQDRKLWYFVREIEREAARSTGQSRRLPSPLFELT